RRGSGRIRRGREPRDGEADPPASAAVPVGLRPLQGTAPPGARRGLMLGSRLLLALLWTLHWLPLPVQAALGRGFGRRLHALAGSRRAIARRNVELCLPELPAGERNRLVAEHFQWLARSILERGLLWYASTDRLRRLIRVEGDVALAERSDRP